MKKQVFTNKEYQEYPYLHFFTYQTIKNGSHSFRYHREGIQKNICCKDLAKAKIKVIEFCVEMSLHSGKLNTGTTTKIVEFGKRWLDANIKPFRHKDTYRVYKGAFKNYIEPAFANKVFNEVKTMELQEFFNSLPQEKGKTIENIKIVLNGIYKYAFAQDIINKNYMEQVIVKRHNRIKGKCLTEEDEKEFIENIKSSDKELTYLVLLYSGVRPSELNSIVFNWIDNTMTVQNGKLKDYQTEKERIIPIFPKLKELKHRLNNEDWKKNTKTTSMRFHRYCPNYRQYDLRHTFITRTKMCGVDDELVSLWTGHTIGKTITQKIYTHYDMRYQQKEAKKIVYKI